MKGQNPVFVFTGMGPQWWAMGRELYDTNAVFRRTAATVDDIFRQVAGWSILDEMLAEEAVSRMTETHIAQPTNFVVQAGLAAMWRACGIEPAAVVGHSVGEVTAAHVAGVLSLEDAVKVSFHRSRIQHKAAGLGTMLAVGLGVAEATALLADHGDRVSVAAANSPSATTLAGDRDALEAIAAELERQGLFNRFLQVEMAYHSPCMDPLRPELLESLSELEPRAPELPLYSTVTGHKVAGVAYGAEYWCRNVREPVYFANAIDGLMTDGHRLFLEVGPHPVLSTSIKESARAAGVDILTVASLRRGEPERTQFLTALGELYTAGAIINWKELYADGGRYVRLPTYPWQRETYWHESEESLSDRLGQDGHPLLGQRLDGPGQVWSSALNSQYLPWLQDHRVEELVVLPGAAYVELGFALQGEVSGAHERVLEDLQFHKALVIDSGKEPLVRLTYDEKTRDYAVHSKSQEHKSWSLHATGKLSLVPLGQPPSVSITEIRSCCKNLQTADTHYASMRARGLHYGPCFQGVRQLWLNPDAMEVLSEIEGHESIAPEDQHCVLHPALLDACFQALLATFNDGDGKVYVPVRIRQVRLWRQPSTRFWCHGYCTRRTPESVEGDIRIFDDTGDVLVEVRGIRVQALAQKSDASLERLADCLYEYAWIKADPEPLANPEGEWLLFMDDHGLGECLAEQLSAAGASNIIRVRRGDAFLRESTLEFRVSPASRIYFDDLFRHVDLTNVRGVLYLWGLDGIASNDDPVGIEGVVSALYLIQALSATHGGQAPRLYFITRGAQPALPEECDLMLAQSPLVGLMRVAVNEYQDLRFCTVDLDMTTDSLAGLMQEVLAPGTEEEIALRGGDRYVRRLVKKSPQALDGGTAFGARAVPSLVHPGASDVTTTPTGTEEPSDRSPQALQAGEVEIEIRGIAIRSEELAGLSKAGSRDARTHRLYEIPFSVDAVGVVANIADDVKEMDVGDRVFTSYHGRLSRRIIVSVDKAFALHLPAHLCAAALAAQIPAFIASHYSLRYLTKLKAGEKILVHNAADILGLTAIEVARAVGAHLYATVENRHQVAQLQSLGVDHILDAKSLDFADQMLELTNGRGIDVAFNTLSGEHASKTLSILSPLGRFIDVRGSKHKGLSEIPAHGNCFIAAVDVRQMIAERPHLFRLLMEDLVIGFQEEVFRPLPVATLTLKELLEQAPAFGDPLAESIALTVDDPLPDRIQAEAAQTRPPLFSGQGTYLVTGGFGGFGGETAKWLVGHGVRHIVLASRRGAATNEAKQLIRHLEKAGATVLGLAVDISKEPDVAELLSRVSTAMPPLRGIFHAAGVLDDRPMAFLERTHFDNVMSPKALGAWYLHVHSRHLSLDHFVLFSSIGSLIGNPGQAPYVVANTFLDALAHSRRARGLPAISINWGALSGVGMVVEHREVQEYFNRVGVGSFSPKQALGVLERILVWNPIQLAVAIFDWPLWGQYNPTWATSPRYRHLITDAAGRDASAADNELHRMLADINPEAHLDTITDVLIDLVAATIHIPQSKIDRRQSLVQIGIDSLMAMELQTAIEKKIGARISTLELMKGNAIEQLAGLILSSLRIDDVRVDTKSHASPGLDDPPGTSSPAQERAVRLDDKAIANPTALLGQLNELTDEEVDNLLSELIQETGGEV